MSLTASDATVTGSFVANTIDANAGTLAGLTVDGTLTVSGGSIVAGGGNVTIDSSGLTLTSGSGASNSLRWSGGATIKDVSNILSISVQPPSRSNARGAASRSTPATRSSPMAGP